MAKEKILVIEDDPSLASLIRINLEYEQYQPILAKDGETGLALLVTEKPDLILLDILLPQMGGFDLLEHLKDSPDTKGIPVIIMTSLGEQQDIDKGYALGAIDYIAKPFNTHQLVVAIEARLRKTSSEKKSDLP